jgi:predicted phosphodiesterase
MKIVVISDVHIDNNPWDWNCLQMTDNDVDAIVVAGDISNNVRITSNWIMELRKRFTNVFWVAGNHDFYNSGFHQTRVVDVFEKQWPYPSNVDEIYKHYYCWSVAHDIHFLHRSSYVLNGITFVGATGWHDFVAGQPFSKFEQIQSWIDYLNDSKHTKWLTMNDYDSVMKAAIEDADAIRDIVKETDGPMVVVSHHLPRRNFAKSQPHDIIWTKLNGSFVNTLMEDIVSPNIKYWIYGHTHFRGIDNIDDIDYVCNARGYRRENPNWKPIILDVV